MSREPVPRIRLPGPATVLIQTYRSIRTYTSGVPATDAGPDRWGNTMRRNASPRHPRTGLRRVLTTALLTALAVGTVGSVGTAGAQAQDLWHSDRRADVLKFPDSAQSTDQGIPAPERANGDLTRVHVVHGAHRISVRARFTDLRRVTATTGIIVRLQTNAGVRRNVLVLGTGSAQPGHHSVAFMAERQHCQVRQSLSYRENLMRVSFPRSCARDPRWIRVGIGSVTVDDIEDESSYLYLDDGFLGGAVGENLHLSRRVYAG